MSEIDTCFKCKYFDYDKYSEEYCCLSELYPNVKESVWKSRRDAYWEYDRDFELIDKVVETCKNTPCNIRDEKRNESI